MYILCTTVLAFLYIPVYTYICMNIFFTASFRGKKTYQANYDKILKKLDELRLIVTSPEKNNYKALLNTSKTSHLKTKQEEHYLAIKKGIEWADAVIMEISEEDFQLGHEATLAIQANKHVLCLSIHEDYSQKIKSRYFHGAKFNDYTYEEILENFINKISTETLHNRFNLFLSDRHKAHLESKAKELGVNKSEYLRMVLDDTCRE